jgi:hypothetical protein
MIHMKMFQGAMGMPGVEETAKPLTGPPAESGGMLTAVGLFFQCNMTV